MSLCVNVHEGSIIVEREVGFFSLNIQDVFFALEISKFFKIRFLFNKLTFLFIDSVSIGRVLLLGSIIEIG